MFSLFAVARPVAISSAMSVELKPCASKVAVVQPVAARVWEIQKRLHVREPRQGFGHLLAALP